MESLVQDIRFAFRSLRRHRTTTAIAVLCLALGIGANTAIFSVVRAVLLATLPFRQPERLVRVYETFPFQGVRGTGSVAFPNYLDFRSLNRVFSDLAAYSGSSRDLVGRGGEPERIRATRSTANLFSVLGAQPSYGRTFAAGEDEPGKASVVILSEGFWARRFGRDASIVGTQISLDNESHTVIGIMPESFDFPIGPLHTDVWIPLVPDSLQRVSRGNHWLQVVARLRSGVDSAAATRQMADVMDGLARQYPGPQTDRGIQITPLKGVIVGRVKPALLVMVGAVALVLLIACANVANLLLAKASSRRREVAIRTALGGQRRRLLRQFLTESALLGIAGGALGLVVAHFSLRAILAFAAVAIPRSEAVGLDPLVLAFALSLSIVTGMTFGIVPALRATGGDLRQDLSDAAGRSATSRSQHRTLDALIVSEIALSLVLLSGAGLLIRGFVALLDTDPGFRAERVLTFHVVAPSGQIADSSRWVAFYQPVLQRLRGLPGVRGAGMTNMLPIQNAGMNGSFTIVGRPEERDPARQPFAEFRIVSSDYFKSLGIAVKRGREFEDRDVHGALEVAIVNEEFARRYFPSEDPIGHQIDAWLGKPSTIVGVVASARQTGLDQVPRSEIYVSAAQRSAWLGDMTYVISTQSSPENLIRSVRDVVRAVAPQQPLFQVATMESVIGTSLTTRKLTLVLLAVFAGLALVLSAAGIYGVMSYGVTQRSREIGIRMALGARGADVTAMVLWGGGKVALLGIAVGLLGALALTGVLKGMLYGVGARDPLTLATVAAVLAGVAVIASLVPARRASRVDPLKAMRTD